LEALIEFSTRIDWLYDASGTKWQKLAVATHRDLGVDTLVSGSYTATETVSSAGTVGNGSNVEVSAGDAITLNPGFTTENGSQLLLQITDTAGEGREYFAGIEYQEGQMEAVYFGEGRVAYENGVRNYQYYLTDHLGNNRVVFKDNGSGQAEILQESHYYAFGMAMEGTWSQGSLSPDNDYLYNGKELDQDFGLDWYHYGARMYDPTIGVFTGTDRFASNYSFQSPYVYAANNPIKFIDVNGDSIRIGGEDSFVTNALNSLQQLTNDKLVMVDGVVHVDTQGGANSGLELSIGTSIIRNLIGIKPDVNIKEGETNKTTKNKDGSVDISFNSTGQGETVFNTDGTTGRPPFIGLGHELIHADNITQSQVDKSAWIMINEPSGAFGIRHIEEKNVREKENLLRAQYNGLRVDGKQIKQRNIGTFKLVPESYLRRHEAPSIPSGNKGVKKWRKIN